MSASFRIKRDLISKSIINAAILGDAVAIHAVLKHYEGYICKLALQSSWREDGQVYRVVDQEIKERLETKLIYGIFKFCPS